MRTTMEARLPASITVRATIEARLPASEGSTQTVAVLSMDYT